MICPNRTAYVVWPLFKIFCVLISFIKNLTSRLQVYPLPPTPASGLHDRTASYLDYHALTTDSNPMDRPPRYQYSPRPEVFRKEIIDQRTQFEMHYRPQQHYYNSNEYAYDNPTSCADNYRTNYGSISLSNIGITGSNPGTNVLPRTPSRLTSTFGHRRNNSNASNNSSINPNFRLEDEDYNYQMTSQNTNPNYHTRTPIEYSSPLRQDTYFSRQNSLETERPFTLEVNTKLRSSLKKYNYNRGNSPKINSNNSGSSGAGTPTNPTPPDSLTSEDSSYVSAKEGSVSRVRFSPITAHMCDGNVQRETIMDMSIHEDTTIPLQGRRTRRPSISELEREFLS